MCNDDEGLFHYSDVWFAQIIQEPWNIIGSALGFRGTEEGTGKSTCIELIGELFGDMYYVTASSEDIYGRWTGHLERVLLLHSEEAVSVNNKGYESKQRDFVSRKTMQVEAKFHDQRTVKKYARLVITGNPDDIAHVALSGRRFTISNVSQKHRNDKAYFDALREEWYNGGREAYMYHLKFEVDIKSVNLRVPYKTLELANHKIASMGSAAAWFVDLCRSGEAPYYQLLDDGRIRIITQSLYNSYLAFCRINKQKRKDILEKQAFSTYLRKEILPEVISGRVIKSDDKRSFKSQVESDQIPNPNKGFGGPSHVKGLILPSLAQCRATINIIVNDDPDVSDGLNWEPSDNWQQSAKTLAQILDGE